MRIVIDDDASRPPRCLTPIRLHWPQYYRHITPRTIRNYGAPLQPILLPMVSECPVTGNTTLR
jgi:hypothetical protein